MTTEPFDYKAKIREYRKTLNERVAEFVFFNKDLTHEEIGKVFRISRDKAAEIARNAGIVRGKGWRPKR